MEKGKYTKEYEKEKIPLKFKFFKLEVLDRYRENPIYEVREFPVSLSLFIKDEYFNDKNTEEENKIGIQSLGYAYRKKDKSKVIVTYLVYLAELPKKHQNYWASFEEEEECILDQDFFEQEIMAKFTDRVNIFNAFLQELVEINKICSLSSKPLFFKKTYVNKKLTEFSWPTKPTYKSYYGLVHQIDKLISENINKGFFSGKIDLKYEIERKDGKIEVIQKNTINLLEEFLNKYFRPQDSEPKDSMIKHFKWIRKERQKPAHNLKENDYDPSYDAKIKEMVTESYRSIRTLRLIFTNFSGTKIKYKPPKWLQEGNIQ